MRQFPLSRTHIIACLAIVMLSAGNLFAQSPIGKWKTIDDESGKARSIIEIYDVNGKLHGKVVKLILEPDEEQNPLCDECSGKKKDQPIIGMEIMWDLEKDGDQWEDGEIMDPDNGKTYSCYIKLENENKLEVRGFLGFSLLGRTQYWYRYDGK
ncbi:MAG: DUF2147 domain-containing protein [Bacteroidota bacterium]